jgi:hypothetical protein
LSTARDNLASDRSTRQEEKMSGHRKTAILFAAAASVSGALLLAPSAWAGQAPAWNGQYLLTVSADAKTGTSPAVRGSEYAQRGSYSLSSNCNTGVCVARVDNAPAPKSQYLPRGGQYTWNGSQWVQQANWNFACQLPNGAIESDPARSITAYTPGARGALNGRFHTDILSGACRGTVDMPVTMTPVQTPVV